MRAEDTATRTTASSAVRYFGDSRCRSIWQWQLVLGLTSVAIAAGVAYFAPTMLTDWRFGAGIFMILVITLVSLGIPWHLVGASAVLVVPLLDTVAIGLLAAGMRGSGTSPSVSFLWVFPVAWVACYYSAHKVLGLLSLIGLSLLLSLFNAGLTPGQIINVVTLLVTLGFVGVIMWVGAERNRAAKQLLKGQSARIGNALRRVTEQKARTQRLFDSLDSGIARASEGGLIEGANRAFRSLYAIDVSASSHPTSAVEYSARRGTPIPAYDTTIARASRGELFTDRRVWLFGLDGQWRALKSSTRVIDGGHTANDGVLLLVEDITEAVDPQASTQATRRTISHELRNPLTAILGHVDLLMEHDEFSPSTRRQLEVVERASNRMQRLIDEVLHPASPTDGADDADDVDVNFDLADIASASIEGFAPVAEAQGVTLTARLDEVLSVDGDAFRIRQVVDNVVGNAIKYAQRGKVTVDAVRREPGEVALVITDTGIGISAEDLPHIFEPAFRTELARERGIPGSGLGLGISRDIVADHGGSLEVSSDLGRGTKVTLVLPSSHERALT